MRIYVFASFDLYGIKKTLSLTLFPNHLIASSHLLQLVSLPLVVNGPSSISMATSSPTNPSMANGHSSTLDLHAVPTFVPVKWSKWDKFWIH